MLGRWVRVRDLMGTVVSAHLIVEEGTASCERAFDAAFAQIGELERVFSPFLPDSDISRIRDGALSIADADPRVAQVRTACAGAQEATGGRFSADWLGWFDPTGYVKGWAVELAFDAQLRSLLDEPGVVAVGLNAGGDMQLATAPGADWEWRVGIAHPAKQGELLATVTLADGAVATSGTAERGAHLVDPRTGEVASGTLSATVVADHLTDADVWATAAAVAGVDDLSWIAAAPHTRGLILGRADTVRRWAGGAELVAATDRLHARA